MSQRCMTVNLVNDMSGLLFFCFKSLNVEVSTLFLTMVAVEPGGDCGFVKRF